MLHHAPAQPAGGQWLPSVIGEVFGRQEQFGWEVEEEEAVAAVVEVAVLVVASGPAAESRSRVAEQTLQVHHPSPASPAGVEQEG